MTLGMRDFESRRSSHTDLGEAIWTNVNRGLFTSTKIARAPGRSVVDEF